MRRAVRRLVQVLAVLLALGAPVYGLWAVGAENRYDAHELAWRYAPAAAASFEPLERMFGTPTDAAPGRIVGGAFSVRLFGVELTDPLAVLGMLGGMALPPGPMALGAALVLAVHVLFGRAMCGWVCPYGIVARALWRIRKRLKPTGLVLDWRPPRWARWVVLGAVAVLPAAGVVAAPAVLPYLALTRSIHAVWFGSAAVIGWFAAMALSDLLLWDAGICRSLCPSGALQNLAGRFRVVWIGATKGVPCIKGCHLCAENCWLDLDPRRGQILDDCDACGRCTEVCPNTRLTTAWRTITPATVASVVLGSGCAPAPVTVVRPTASWTSAFEQVGAQRRGHTLEWTDPRHGALSVSWIEDDHGDLALRLYVEEAPGTPWDGPLAVGLGPPDRAVQLRFDAPNSPRSVRRPAQYEATVAVSGPLRIEILDGPHQGEAHRIRVRTAAAIPWAPAGAVVGAWCVGLVVRRVRKDTPAEPPAPPTG